MKGRNAPHAPILYKDPQAEFALGRQPLSICVDESTQFVRHVCYRYIGRDESDLC